MTHRSRNHHQALEHLLRQEKPRLREAQRQIDDALAEHYDGGAVHLTAQALDNLAPTARTLLIERYRAEGWSVSHHENGYLFGRLR